MHNSLNRVQGVFGFFTTVVAFLGGFIALSDFVIDRAPSVGQITPTNLQVYVHCSLSAFPDQNRHSANLNP